MTCEAFIANLLQQKCVLMVSCVCVLIEKEISVAAKVICGGPWVFYFGNTSTSADLEIPQPQLNAQLSPLSHGSSKYSNFLSGSSPPYYV